MKKLFIFSFVFSVLLAVSGCAYHEAHANVEKSRDLRIGMTKQQVLKIMGEPVKNQKYVSPDVWFYYTCPQWIDGLTTEDECLPLVFRDGKLIGWGWEYYEKARILREFGK
ncbi:MAG: DUF3192 domain-containing protein [Victivallales bacterium]|nr:DUF3192 domain-containing protein [Victivallales bacterium]